MKSAEARKLGNDFFINNSFSKHEKEQALNYVSAAIEKYGKDILDYCLKLPKKPFKITNVKELLHSLI